MLLHPTQLYSICANVVIGLLLWRFWRIEASHALITGVYFMLTGIARFVEEAYRGEPQTPIVAGLRLYQWLAAASLLGGIVLTTLPSGTLGSGPGAVSGASLAAAIAIALAVGVAMGIDFPDSARRFARLAPP